MRHAAMSAILLWGLSGVLVAQKAPPPADRIAVLITAGGATDGFTDPNKDREDGRKDLAEKLTGSKWVRLVQKPEDAVMVVEVVGREDTPSERTVRATLTVAGRTTEMVGRAGVMGGKRFGRAAGNLGDQIEEWVKANFAKLASLRSER